MLPAVFNQMGDPIRKRTPTNLCHFAKPEGTSIVLVWQMVMGHLPIYSQEWPRPVSTTSILEPCFDHIYIYIYIYTILHKHASMAQYIQANVQLQSFCWSIPNNHNHDQPCLFVCHLFQCHAERPHSKPNTHWQLQGNSLFACNARILPATKIRIQHALCYTKARCTALAPKTHSIIFDLSPRSRNYAMMLSNKPKNKPRTCDEFGPKQTQRQDAKSPPWPKAGNGGD